MFVFIYIALGLACWALMTWLPLGRMKVFHQIKTDADLQELRKLYTGRNKKRNWYPNSQVSKIVTGTDEKGIEFTDYIIDDPLPPEEEAYKFYHRSIITHEDEYSIASEITIAMGVELPAYQYLYENLTIERHQDHNIINIEQSIMRHGLLGSANSKQHLQQYMRYLVKEAGDTLHTIQKPKVRFLALWSIPLMMAAGYYFLNGWFGFFAALILSLVILLHELGHGLAMRLFGHKFIDIALIPFGGGIAMSNQAYKSRFEMATIAVAGPLISAIFMVLLILFTNAFDMDHAFKLMLSENPMDHIVEMIADLVALSFIFVILLVNVLNLFPKRGLDGGEVIAAIANSKIEYYSLGFFFGGIVALLSYQMGIPLWIIALEIVLISFVLFRGNSIEVDLPNMTGKEKMVSLSMLSATFFFYISAAYIAQQELSDLPNSVYMQQLTELYKPTEAY